MPLLHESYYVFWNFYKLGSHFRIMFVNILLTFIYLQYINSSKKNSNLMDTAETPSIFYTWLIQLRVTGGLEPIPAVFPEQVTSPSQGHIEINRTI